MIRINLLPPELRKKIKVPFIDRTFIYGVLALVGEVILLYLVSLTQQTKIAELDSKIAAAQLQFDKYKTKSVLLNKAQQLRSELVNRMSAVQELENKRAYWVKIISEFSSLIPEFLWVDRFEEKSEGVINCSAKSYTLKSIASFLVNLAKSKNFGNIKLGPINQNKMGKLSGYAFTLTMDIKKQGQEEKLGSFVVDTAMAEQARKKGYKSFVSSTRSKLGLYGKEEAKKMFQGIND